MVYHCIDHSLYLNGCTLTHSGETKWTPFRDDLSKCIFWNENVWILINISLKFVPKGEINIIPALVQIMYWCRSGDKPLSDPMMFSLLTHLCVIPHEWDNDEACYPVTIAGAIFLVLCDVVNFDSKLGAPAEKIYGYPIFKWVTATWFKDRIPG